MEATAPSKLEKVFWKDANAWSRLTPSSPMAALRGEGFLSLGGSGPHQTASQ